MLPRTHHHPSSGGRRRSLNAPQICAALTALLLLLSLAVLHSRLSLSLSSLPFHPSSKLQDYPSLSSDPFDDADNDAFDGTPDDDRIDVLDLDTNNSTDPNNNDDEPESDDDPQNSKPEPDSDSSALVWDHALAVHRRSFGKPEPDPDPNPDPDRIEIAFASDDQPLGDRIRSRLHTVKRIEDVLMVRAGSDNPLREGWAPWLEGKGDFLRRDKMLKSNLELLNPKNHPLLQDPDMAGLSSYTRGDKLVQKSILKEMEKVPFPFPNREVRVRRSLQLEKEDDGESGRRRWGYFPGIDEKGRLLFSEFVERFFEMGRCGIRVFMVWNSPSWMFGVRQQRGLESVLKVHRDACVVVLSETMEMDFFESFVKDGFKVAVAMPDLDELLKDTPTHEFSSLWYDWRQTKHYPVHYSELIRLAALYKYGGIYLDSDIIVLKPLYSLKNSVGIENQIDGSSIFNGAVMAFDKYSDTAYNNTQDSIFISGKDIEDIMFDQYIAGDVIHFYIEHLKKAGRKKNLFFRVEAWHGIRSSKKDYEDYFIRNNLTHWNKDTDYMFFPMNHAHGPNEEGFHWTLMVYDCQTQEWIFYNTLIHEDAVSRANIIVPKDSRTLKERMLQILNAEAASRSTPITPLGRPKTNIRNEKRFKQQNSPFLMECLKEFYSTYDDARLRWNGADLLTRVINRLNSKGDKSSRHVDVKGEPPLSFFPISSANITWYFGVAENEIEKSKQEALFTKILNESTAFHFWSGLTSALVPEPESLVERLLNHNCIRCHDLL